MTSQKRRFKQPIEGSAVIEIEAPADLIYELVSDVTRMGEWSPECTGGKWLGAASGPTVGARFKGTNKKRFAWSTKSKVVLAEPGKAFTFDRDRPILFGVMRWSYELTPLPTGTRVTESFEQVRTAPAISVVAANLATGVRWNQREAVNTANMQVTLERLKACAEELARLR